MSVIAIRNVRKKKRVTNSIDSDVISCYEPTSLGLYHVQKYLLCPEHLTSHVFTLSILSDCNAFIFRVLQYQVREDMCIIMGN